MFLKSRYFVMGGPIDMNVGLSKKCDFATFPEI